MINVKTINRIIAAITFSLTAIATTAEVVVIVHVDNAMTSINKTDLSRIFLGKIDTFPDGSKVSAINQISASGTRSSFDTDVLRKTTKQMNAYWSRQLFSGRGAPPPEVNGDIDVLQHISKNRDSIGYIDSSAANQSVKVLKIN
ncbi:MAG: phosphate ABC transporter substrate-binding protein [Spongiibacteraceae bacterium]|nr:phosphate ABC transporter substrate-binding protein [Spongiibacteraceae bacterium]